MAIVPYTEDRPVDFRTLYLGQHLLLDGKNPYDDAVLKQAWRDIAADGEFETEIEPGLPRTPLVYPPWAVALFTVFGPLSYQLASRVWYVMLPVLLLGFVGVLAGFSERRERAVVLADLLVIAFAFKATEWAYWVGQPVFLCLILGVTSWWLAEHDRPVLSGIALGLAAFKITLAIPFVVLFLYRRRFGVLAVAAMTGAALITVFVALVPDPVAAAAALRQTVAELRRITFDPSAPGYPLAFKMVTKTELLSLVECLFTGAHRWASVINGIPLVILAWFWGRPLARSPHQLSAAGGDALPSAGFSHLSVLDGPSSTPPRPSNRKRGCDQHLAAFATKPSGNYGPARSALDDTLVFSILAVATLLSTHHLHYDCLVLLPVYLVARTVGPRRRVALLACGLVFVLPINGALNLLPPVEWLQWLYFNVQLGLIGLAAVLTWIMMRPSRTSPS